MSSGVQKRHEPVSLLLKGILLEFNCDMQENSIWGTCQMFLSQQFQNTKEQKLNYTILTLQWKWTYKGFYSPCFHKSQKMDRNLLCICIINAWTWTSCWLSEACALYDPASGLQVLEQSWQQRDGSGSLSSPPCYQQGDWQWQRTRQIFTIFTFLGCLIAESRIAWTWLLALGIVTCHLLYNLTYPYKKSSS